MCVRGREGGREEGRKGGREEGRERGVCQERERSLSERAVRGEEATGKGRGRKKPGSGRFWGFGV